MKLFLSFYVRPKTLIDSFVIFCFFSLKLFPIAMRLSTEIFSLLTEDSRLRVGSWNSKFFPDNFAEPFATQNTNSSSLRVVKTSFVFSLQNFFLMHLFLASSITFSIFSISMIRMSSFQIHSRGIKHNQ